MDNEDGYVPTLAQYAVIIEWMSSHPSEDIPVHMERDYKDAMHRAELRGVFSKLNALVVEEE